MPVILPLRQQKTTWVCRHLHAQAPNAAEEPASPSSAFAAFHVFAATAASAAYASVPPAASAARKPSAASTWRDRLPAWPASAAVLCPVSRTSCLVAPDISCPSPDCPYSEPSAS